MASSMITLAIETSCDETAICLLETKVLEHKTAKAKEEIIEYRILANLIHSQIDLHAKYGGVFPMMAKREHSKNIVPLVLEALTQANIDMKPADFSHGEKKEIEKILSEKEPELLAAFLSSNLVKERPSSKSITQIAVTKGPGLEPALWVGVNFARALGGLWDIPVIGINHMEGHILGSLLPSSAPGIEFKKLRPVNFPALALLISGGHTELALVKNVGDYEVIGRTKDDAVGEAFDKVARMLDMSYPGGPAISELAHSARIEAGFATGTEAEKTISLPRPMLHSKDLHFSFSGLKTAVLYATREIKKVAAATGIEKVSDALKKEIAREFEDAVTEVLIKKTEKALDTHAVGALMIGGGVTANKHISGALKKLAEKHFITFYAPPAGVSGDNALMIALSAALRMPLHAAGDHISDKKHVENFHVDGNLSF